MSRKFGAAMQNIGEMSPPEVFTSGDSPTHLYLLLLRLVPRDRGR